MPPPEKPLPLPLPKPKPKPKPPKPKSKQPKPEPRPRPEPVREKTTTGGVPLRPDPISCAVDCSATCAFYKSCPPPPPPPPPAAAASRATTVHLRSSRLPTPLIALSASLLAVSVVLLLALLACHLARRRRRGQAAPHEAPLTTHHGDDDVEGVPAAVAGVEEDGEGGVHHVWYIRTVGLDERAISAITALVYDAKKCGVVGLGGGGDGGGCAVCLAEFRNGETLRLLPRCRHAFHRGCIDTWLRAHVNCPLCRAPVQVAAAANATPGTATIAPGVHREANPRSMGASETRRGEADGSPERAVRRAASMVALPRRALLPDAAALRAPASNSWRVGEEMGLAKVTRLMKFSEVLEMAGIGVGRSVSFGAAIGGLARRLPAPTPTRCHGELLDAAASVTTRD